MTLHAMSGTCPHCMRGDIPLPTSNENTDLRIQLDLRTEQLRKEYLSAIQWAGKCQELTEQLAGANAYIKRLDQFISNINVSLGHPPTHWTIKRPDVDLIDEQELT